MTTIDDPFSCDSEAARLLPWFVTGRLTPEETARVEAHLVACAACRAEVDGQRELHRWLREEPDDAGLGPASFRKLADRIEETQRAMPAARDVSARPDGTARSRLPPWLVAVVVVQAAGLATLGATLWQQANARLEPGFQTLSTVTGVTGVRTSPELRVVFAPDATARDLARLLAEIDASIVDGPSSAGAYALAIRSTRAAPEGRVAAALAQLRADARVVLAEPIGSGATP
jgi:hypothetical protein